MVGRDLARTDWRFRKAYGILRDALRRADAPDVTALHPESHRDWVAELGRALEDLERFRALGRERDDRARSAAVLFDELRSVPSRHLIPEDPEGVRLLREGIARLRAYLPLREELARFALPYRSVLGSAFDFLWKVKSPEGGGRDPVEKKANHLTRRRILERMLGRMLSKNAIGGVHAPLELVLRGFPPHQGGLAKEALDAACQAGLVSRKGTPYGERVYLEPVHVRAARAFCKGRDFGLAALDRWVAEDERSDAA
jgi:hypothetical protein